MSRIGEMIAERQQQTEEFKARKTAEREELSELGDAAIRAVTQQPEAYLRVRPASARSNG